MIRTLRAVSGIARIELRDPFEVAIVRTPRRVVTDARESGVAAGDCRPFAKD
jgi:hypothetical protein